MSDPNVRETGRMEDFDGTRVAIGIDYDTVTIGYPGRIIWRLAADDDTFVRMYFRALEAVHAMQERRSEADDPEPGDA